MCLPVWLYKCFKKKIAYKASFSVAFSYKVLVSYKVLPCLPPSLHACLPSQLRGPHLHFRTCPSCLIFRISILWFLSCLSLFCKWGSQSILLPAIQNQAEPSVHARHAGGLYRWPQIWKSPTPVLERLRQGFFSLQPEKWAMAWLPLRENRGQPLTCRTHP